MTRFFPARRRPIDCPSCKRACRSPLVTVWVGLAVFLPLAVIGLALLKAIGLTESDTIPSILVYGVAFFLIALAASHLASRASSAQIDRLDP